MSGFVYAGAGEWRGAAKDVRTGGLYRLRPGAEAWESLERGLPANVEVRAILVRPDDPQTVYAGTQDGPYVSTDGGDSWRSLNLPGDRRVVWSMCLHPTERGTMYVGTEHTSVFRTRDGGAHWDRLPVPEPEGMIRKGFPMRVVRIALDPSAPHHVYVAMEVGGLVRSLDGGDSWADCNAPLLAMAREERLKSSIISDASHEGMLDSHAVATSRTHPGTLHLANRMGIFASEDRGETWAEIGIGRFSPLTYTRDVQVSLHDPETMYAALSIAAISDAGSLYRSRDYGRSWQRVDHGVSIDSTLMTIGQSPTSADRIWCGARRGQVFGTEDGGRSWSTRPLPRVEGVYAVACS